MAWLLRITTVDDIEGTSDRLWELGTNGIAELPHDGDIELLAGFDEEAAAHHAAAELGGAVETYDPTVWADPTPVVVSLPGGHTIELDASTAFGHGEHPTTSMIMDALIDDPPVGSLLDVGSGTGVLAIAAARLGADPVTAVDNDPAAVIATAANAERNGVVIDMTPAITGRFDVVVANLLVADLRGVADQIVAATGARLIVSGFLAEQVDEVATLLAPLHTTVTRRTGEWVCLELARYLRPSHS